ncbi:Na+/H+ antiporter NhaC family protein [Anoxybacteroides tepidamans]|uniref:Na+/H+ antiporter NhaC family protein n=1 Tax=Anoxybacteroides tepidamans TaxID=265948 RepID=UPI000481F57E|nr:Na+/H+ antiporter NhaC family protein [Anoxybacillus tepidamans]
MTYDISFSNREMLGLLLTTLLGIFISVVCHITLLIGFTPGLLFLIAACKKKGVGTRDLMLMGLRGAMKTKEVIIILLFVSMLLPMWELSGTINEMVALFLHFLSKDHFLFLAFLFMVLTSLLLGTAVGSLSALGIPIISAASSLHLPLDIVAGALISGAFVGDRTSIFSSAYQLLAHTVEVPLYRQLRKLLPTTILAVGLSAALYALFDSMMIPASSAAFSPHISANGGMELFIALMPPAVLLTLVCFRIKIKYAFLSSICCAAAVALLRGVPALAIVNHLWIGGERLGGGVHSMLFLLLFIAVAGVYNGILEELQLVQPFLNRWLADARSLVSYSWRTIVASLFIAVVACNQTLPIILTGRSFLFHWQKNYSREELARIMADSTMLFPGLIPWSILAIMCSTITKVPVLSYMPYAIFLWSLPLMTLFISYGKQVRAKEVASADKFF